MAHTGMEQRAQAPRGPAQNSPIQTKISEAERVTCRLEDVAHNIGVQGQKITFTSREPVHTFEIRYKCEDGTTSLENNTEPKDKILKNNYLEKDGKSTSTTTNIAQPERYSCDIEPQADGTTKFTVTFDPQIRVAHIEVNNKTALVQINSEKSNPRTQVTGKGKEAQAALGNENSVHISRVNEPPLSSHVKIKQLKELDPRDIDSIDLERPVSPGSSGTVSQSNTAGVGLDEKASPISNRPQEILTRTGAPSVADLTLPKFTPPPESAYLPRYAIATDGTAYSAIQMRTAKPLTTEEKLDAIKKSLADIKNTNIDSAKTFAKTIADLDKFRADFEKIQKAEVKAIEKALGKEVVGSNEAIALQSKVDAIKSLQEEFLDTKISLAEKAMHADDTSVKYAGKRVMIDIRDDVLKRFDEKAVKAGTPDELKSIAQEREQFLKANNKLIEEAGTLREKAVQYFKNSKTDQGAIQNPAPQNPAPTTLTTEEKLAAMKQSLSEIRNTKVDSVDSLAKKTTELDTLVKDFEKLQKAEAEVQESSRGKLMSKKEARAHQIKIGALKSMQEELLEARKTIAETAMQSKDPAVSLAGKRAMVALRDEIVKDYDEKILRPRGVQHKQLLVDEKEKFLKANDQLIEETKTLRQKVLQYFEKNKTYEGVVQRISPAYNAVKEFFGKDAVSRAEEALALGEKDFSKLTANTIERHVLKLEKVEDALKIEAIKNPAKLEELEKVSEVKAKMTIELEDKLSAEVDNAKKLSADTKYQDKLYSEHSERIVKAREKLGLNTDEYKSKQAAYKEEQAKRSTLIKNESFISEAKKIAKRMDELNHEIKKSPDSELLKAEKKYLELRRDTLNIEKEISTIDPKDARLILEKREALQNVKRELLNSKGDYYEQIEKTLGDPNISAKERVALEKIQEKLTKSLDSMEKLETQEQAELEKARGNAKAAVPNENIEDIQKKLEAKTEELKNAKDGDVKKTLQSQIGDLQHQKDLYNKFKVEAEIEANDKVQTLLKERIDQLKKNVGNELLSDQSKPEMEKEIKVLEKQIKVCEANNKYLVSRKEIYDTKVQLANQDANLKKLITDLEQTTDAVVKQRLTQDIETLKPQVSELADKVLKQENILRAETFKLVTRGKALFQQNVMPEMIKRNPVLAATAAGIIAEASFSALSADYTAEGKHSAFPSLITMLNQDFREWSEFTTADVGEGWAVAGEVSNSVSNVGIISGLFVLGKKGIGYAGVKVAPPVAVLKAAGIAGAAVHGFNSFASLDLANANNRQIAGEIGSTMSAFVIAGATTGSFVPIPFVGTGGGAVAGAAVGFVVDLSGVSYNLLMLNTKYENDYVKKGIKDSIERASQGIIRAKDGVGVYKGRLSDDAQEVVDSYAKLQMLSLILNGEKADKSRLFEIAEVEALGLKISKPGMSASEVQQIQTDNWERVEALFTRKEGGILFTDQINSIKDRSKLSRGEVDFNRSLDDQISKTSDENVKSALEARKIKSPHLLGEKLEEVRNSSYTMYEDLYRRSFKKEYETTSPNSGFDLWIGTNSNNMGGARITKDDFVAEVQLMNRLGGLLNNEEDKEVVMNMLRENFPQFDQIFMNEATANLFINSFMTRDTTTNEHSDTPISLMLREHYSNLKDVFERADKNLEEIAKM